ncbi:COP9 signalosome complex subunit 4 [Neolecta irregularis DAH-3]|uniref:COP9 signalosome complex subunit 4 n=1 Tax=Neolecta irregularis (strain DAH-3) TaxID=1198029 RepID=A0A1U7LVN7_NEOID|nr:COP9 signalosome complex subunit 4 [Neolecta irregularis DAH-3]|eukprot:OLL26688.1 COP9 signalosome complex subunit 4 [Neolecta irregularis DAH-3]
MSLADSLSNVNSLTSSSDKVQAYRSVLEQIYANSQNLQQSLSEFLLTIIQESHGLAISRPALTDYVHSLDQITDPNQKLEILKLALDTVQPRYTSFEEQVCTIRENLAAQYELLNKHEEAAKTLQGIQLESGQRVITEDYKLKILIRIIRNLLEIDDAITADTYLNRAQLLIHITDDPELLLPFKAAQAKCFDAKRMFVQASSKYHEISYETVVDGSERLQCLSNSIICGVLAPAGPLRSRLLANLYKDDRAAGLAEFEMLEKMHLDRLISPAQTVEFSKKLKGHQLATVSDGTTVLEQAVLEHNLLSASMVYDNIGFGELARVLGINEEKAEEYAAKMIEQGRLMGEIDQIKEFIYFNVQEDGFIETRRWDKNIEALCQAAENIGVELEKIEKVESA